MLSGGWGGQGREEKSGGDDEVSGLNETKKGRVQEEDISVWDQVPLWSVRFWEMRRGWKYRCWTAGKRS